MPLYECVVIARNDITQQQVEAIVDGLTAQLDIDNGVAEGETSVKKREYWGLRGLAYRIKKNRRGHYMLLGLETQSAPLKELERQLSLNEDVLRTLTIRVEAIDEAPSAILARKSDDRERGFRGPKPAGRFDSGRKRGFDDAEDIGAGGKELAELDGDGAELFEGPRQAFAGAALLRLRAGEEVEQAGGRLQLRRQGWRELAGQERVVAGERPARRDDAQEGGEVAQSAQPWCRAATPPVKLV